ncbi:hypothetical protein ACIROD_07365 [Peribacillus sp. NPDC101481]|uniref:hypothetical protein n=1 Tax=Bacillaceae TaxID=186817 RepID=UPI000C342390|nr:MULTISPECIES: hypothetical protein [Bacillaceae]MCT4478881.1 hypothetical protein [Peribacillus frigoritolerans]PKF89925.1 hypothetical protein CW306_08990 [Bacillus sp. BA3]CAH0197609.1 hypothetical protein SRABI134_01908 [Peribacillus sp. Bi134]
MRVLLELIRIILIFGIAGTIISSIVNGIYINIGVNQYGWLGSIAILILLFVWYRNKLQFSGWYSGKGKEKLPKTASQILILCSLFLLCAPPVLSFVPMIFH